MAKARAIVKRRKAVRNIRKITKTMQMIATAKFQKALKRAVSTSCPGVLFTFARAAVSQLVSQGGFPQFLLPPVNFEALYAANQAQPAVTN